MDTLTKFTYQMGARYRIVITLMHKVLTKHKLQFSHYESMVRNIQEGADIEVYDVDNMLSTTNRKTNARKVRDQNRDQQSPTTTESKRPMVSFEEIKHAWTQCPRRISKEDWLEWLRKFNIDLIKESPALSLRSCYPIAQACNTVARDLFNPAFLTCWNELNTDQQKVSGLCVNLGLLHLHYSMSPPGTY